MLRFLRSQLEGLSSRFYWALNCCCGVVLALSYWEGSRGLGLFVAILGILYAFFAGVGKLICFVFGVLYSSLYAYIAFGVGLYGDVMLHLFYLPINLMGIFMWREHQIQAKVIVRSLERVSLALLMCFLLAIPYALLLDSMGGVWAYLNALSVVLQIVAFVLQVKRYVQNYALVTLANCITIVMWWAIYREDPKSIPQFLNMCVFLGIGMYYWRIWAREVQAGREILR